MTISLQNQTVVVTGGAKRLGRAIALECARAGASVAITYRTSQAQARETVGLLQEIAPNARFEAFELEISDSAAVSRFTDEVFERFENVTGLVNNAAIFRRTPFDALSEADFDAHIDANLKGPFLLCRAFGAKFLEQNGGSIVNMADIYGIRPLANYIPYCVSKAGLIMLTQSLAKALAPSVRVNCIAPGTILLPSETQGGNNSPSHSKTDDETNREDNRESNSEANEEAALIRRIPFGRLGRETEIAQTALFLLGGPAFVTGTVLPVDGAQILR